MSTTAKDAPREWSLANMLDAIREAGGPKLEEASIHDLRRRARKRELPKPPDVDSLRAALGRIVAAVHGKPTGEQRVIVGEFPDGTKRYGFKRYSANVESLDVIAVGIFLDQQNAHDDRTRVLYRGASKAKWKPDKPHYVLQLVDELIHLLETAQKAGA
jgi:hypothetical protein